MPDYNRWRSRSFARNVGPPVVLLIAIAGLAFALAKLHLARPSASTAAGGKIVLGDQYKGETLFAQTCAGCHGQGGTGGGIGPRLRGAAIPLSLVVDRINNGKGVMPAGLYHGQDERDVLAYVNTLIKPPKG